jgi:hypothetical protein
MPKKNHKPEEFVAKLRHADMLIAQVAGFPTLCARSA